MIVVRAAVGFTYLPVTVVGNMFIRIAAVMMMRTMMATVVLRMNLFACAAFDKCGNELMICRMTCMQIKPYDTQTVPQSEQKC